jgi:GntR family transcriptional repressor for pyruvate dehydrogenase complex
MSEPSENSHPPQTLVENAVNNLIKDIRDNNLKVGDAIPSEREVAEKLGVSRTVVRESFKVLAAMHIIEVGAGRRARVRKMDGSVISLMMSQAVHTEQMSTQQVWDARRTVESRSVELAAIHRTQKEADKLVHLIEVMRKSSDDAFLMTKTDLEFHSTIATASRNPLFPILVSALTSAMIEYYPTGWKNLYDHAEHNAMVDRHKKIVDAIVSQDRVLAVEAMSQHFNATILKIIDNGLN